MDSEQKERMINYILDQHIYNLSAESLISRKLGMDKYAFLDLCREAWDHAEKRIAEGKPNVGEEYYKAIVDSGFIKGAYLHIEPSLAEVAKRRAEIMYDRSVSLNS